MTKGRERASSVEGTAESRRASWRRQSLPETETLPWRCSWYQIKCEVNTEPCSVGRPSDLALKDKVDLAYLASKLIASKSASQRTFPRNLPGFGN